MRLFSLIAMLMAAIAVHAIPAKPIWKTFRQSDGSMLKVKLVGDEHFSYWVTEDQIPLVRNQQDFYYAQVSEGKLSTTGVLAHEPKVRTVSEMKSMATIASVETLRPVVKKELGVSKSYTGSKKGLIILVDFPDQKFNDDNPQETWNRVANEVGYSENDHIGSVHDYFYDQSYGQFDLTFDVVGPVTMSKMSAYYGSDQSGHQDVHVGEMIKEACLGADASVNFQDYDWDHDGVVDQVFVLYAGLGQATGGTSDRIWPHEYQLQYAIGSTLNLDGVTVNTYACSNELYEYTYQKGASTRTRMVNMGIGVICHEFSHCLGIPDFYDTDYSGNRGMGSWDLLAAGSYNGPKAIGEIPPGFTSYERNFAGWLDIEKLDKQQVNVSGMLPLTRKGAKAYALYNPQHPDEYFLLENRAIESWDRYVGHNQKRNYDAKPGLLILHVNYSQSAWASNSINSGSMQRLAIMGASGESTIDESRDTYPLGQKDSITAKTSPSFSLFNRNTDGSYQLKGELYDIALNANGALSFAYYPNGKSSTGISSTYVDAAEVESVYNLHGQQMQSVHQLPHGIYLVKYKNGDVRKQWY